MREHRAWCGADEIRTGAAAAVAVLTAFVVGRLVESPWWATAALLAIALVLLTLIARARRRGLAQRQQLRRVEDRLRGLLATSWESESTPNQASGPSGGPYAPLHRLASKLEEQLAAQLEEVARKTRNLESLIGALDEPVLGADSRDRVFLSNRAAEKMLDAPENGLLGRPLHDVITHEALLERHARARRGETTRTRVQLVTPLGPRTFQVSASPVPAAHGRGVFGVVLLLRDITDLEKAVQVKTDFVANASHELRTPVAAIKGAAETLALLGADERDQTERLVRMIDANATRLEAMLGDLMDLSRLESDGASVTVAPLALADLTEPLRALFEEICRRRGVTLAFDLALELEGFPTDPRLLLLTLRNLVDNASRFAREGTAVRVVGRRRSAADLVTGAGQDVARFEVIDKGPGIPLEHKDRVFERYYQVEPARTGGATQGARRGTGLGLAIVKHAVRVLGGSIGIESVYGQGTTVWLEIPAMPLGGSAPAAEDQGTGR